MGHKATIVSGRTIAAKRERLETANERAAARKKDKRKNMTRIAITIFGIILLLAILIYLLASFINQQKVEPVIEQTTITEEKPTVEIIDESASSGDNNLSSRMKNYIGMAEKDYRDLGYNPVRVVVPSDSIRVIHFYLEGFSGYIKMTIDRDPAVSAEDADRLIRYLKEQGNTDFEYLDVRIDQKAYWK